MKEIKLTQGQVALVDDEDFEELNQFKWQAAFAPNTQSYYAVRSFWIGNNKIKSVKMHRVIMGVTDPKIKVDHIHHDTLNNCRSNLRIANNSESQANRRSAKNSTSKYLGVRWHKGGKKWLAKIQKDKKQIHLGIYDNEEDAARAYNAKAIEIHGEFANLNKIAV